MAHLKCFNQDIRYVMKINQGTEMGQVKLHSGAYHHHLLQYYQNTFHQTPLQIPQVCLDHRH